MRPLPFQKVKERNRVPTQQWAAKDCLRTPTAFSGIFIPKSQKIKECPVLSATVVGPVTPQPPRAKERKITMLEDLICSTRPVRLPALPASRQGWKHFHLYARPYAGGGSTDAGSSICPLPKGVRLPREGSFHPLFSGAAVILLNAFYNRDGLMLYRFPEN